MPVSEDTKSCLDEVKKGKPRRFVMICKGVSIVSMIVYKKGTAEKYKKEAKKEGKGQFYHGVVSGKGLEIEFHLLRSDGYEKPPGKTQTLKDFLKTEANLVFKPTYQIVDVLPDVSEQDDEELQSEDGLNLPGESEPEGAVDGPPVSEDNPADLFKTRLATIIPRIKVAAGTPAAEDAKLKASEAGVFARKQDFSRAIALLDLAEQRLNESSSSAEEVPASPAEAPADLFKARLTALIPQIKQAAGRPGGDEARLKASEAGVFARKGDFAQANRFLDEAQRLVDQAGGRSDVESNEQESEESASSDELLHRIEEVQTQAARLPQPAKSELLGRATVTMAAATRGDAKELAADIEALESDLARAMSAARVAEAVEVIGDRVSFRRLQLKWMEAQQRARQQLGVFVKTLLDDQKLQGDDRYEQLIEVTGEILGQIPEFGNRIDDALVAIDDAKDDAERQAALSAAMAALDEYSEQLEGAKGLRELQEISDEAYSGISFFSELKNALDSLGAQLAKTT